MLCNPKDNCKQRLTEIKWLFCSLDNTEGQILSSLLMCHMTQAYVTLTRYAWNAHLWWVNDRHPSPQPWEGNLSKQQVFRVHLVAILTQNEVTWWCSVIWSCLALCGGFSVMTYMFHILCWHGNMVVLLSKTLALPWKKNCVQGHIWTKEL